MLPSNFYILTGELKKFLAQSTWQYLSRDLKIFISFSPVESSGNFN
jgi:hypothetical protein